MTTPIDHNKLLKRIAKGRLKPYGIFQQGQSRTFLYDKGWFTIVIEFQPSSWSKGTHLNIGIDFNFYPRAYFAFSYGDREKRFEEFNDEGQFTELVNELCNITIERVKQLDQKFQDIWTALKTLEQEGNDDTWRLYDIAVLNALTNNFDTAQKLFRQIYNEKCEYEWQTQRKQMVLEILNWTQDKPEFLNNIKKLIYKTRQLKKLPTTTLDDIAENNYA